MIYEGYYATKEEYADDIGIEFLHEDDENTLYVTEMQKTSRPLASTGPLDNNFGLYDEISDYPRFPD